MARIRIASTSGASENTIVFSPAGGHSHNGRNSSLIDSTAYSIYDFSPTFVGTEVNPDRAVRQENNRIAFEDLIKRVVNNSVLAPAGIRLEPGSLNGSLIIANTITANQLAANTITASEIAAGAITATQLSSNIVLINNRITSQNWNGIIESNGAISNIGTLGWAITSAGEAVFDSSKIRGSVAANSLLTPNLTISNTGAITSTSFNVTAGGNVTATNANITGSITSGSGAIGGWTIDTNRIYGGSTYLYSNGSMAIGATTIAANGQITNGGYTLSAAGALSATGASLTGTVNATAGKIAGWLVDGQSLRNDVNESDTGQQIILDSDTGIYSLRYLGGIFNSGAYTELLLNYGTVSNGIRVRGTVSGSYQETSIYSSFIETPQIILNGTSIATSLAGKSSTGHTHTSTYVNTSGDTMTGQLNGTSAYMSGMIETATEVRVGGKLNCNGTVEMDQGNSGSTTAVEVTTAGTVGVFCFPTGTGGQANQTMRWKSGTGSSIRFKENINTIEEATSSLSRFWDLNVIEFEYKDEYGGAVEKERPYNHRRRFGFIAEDAEEKVPYFASYDDNSLVDNVKFDSITAVLYHEVRKMRQFMIDNYNYNG
jgi:hypothetical protein